VGAVPTEFVDFVTRLDDAAYVSPILVPMGAISNLRRCGDLTEDHAHEAAASSASLQLLLERVAVLAQPGDGGAALLLTLGRVATAARWLDASFCVEISGDDVESTVEIYADRGAKRERVVPATILAVPVDEFIAAVELNPDVAGSLRVDVEPSRLVLTSRTSGEIPVTYDVADESQKEETRKTKPAPPDFDAPRRMSGTHERFDLLADPPPSQGAYTRTTVPKMTAVTPEAIARFDPRREPDE
jgi:hypothetical protein